MYKSKVIYSVFVLGSLLVLDSGLIGSEQEARGGGGGGPMYSFERRVSPPSPSTRSNGVLLPEAAQESRNYSESEFQGSRDVNRNMPTVTEGSVRTPQTRSGLNDFFYEGTSDRLVPAEQWNTDLSTVRSSAVTYNPKTSSGVYALEEDTSRTNQGRYSSPNSNLQMVDRASDAGNVGSPVESFPFDQSGVGTDNRYPLSNSSYGVDYNGYTVPLMGGSNPYGSDGEAVSPSDIEIPVADR